MAKPQFVTDPAEIIRMMRARSPAACIEAQRLLSAMAEHAPAHELRAAVRRLARAQGMNEATSLAVAAQVLRPRRVD